MSSLYDNLMTKDIQELVCLAMQQGLPKPHHKAKKETIAKMIVEAIDVTLQSKTQHPDQDATVIEPQQMAGPVFMTREECENMLAPIKHERPEFEAIYSCDDTVVTFRCRGAEECHNLSTSPRWLKQRADIVKRGRLVPIGLDNRDFGGDIATGKNSYTNVILR